MILSGIFKGAIMGLFRKPKTFMCYCEHVRAEYHKVLGLLSSTPGGIFYGDLTGPFGRLSCDAQTRIRKKANELWDVYKEEMKKEYAGIV